MLLNLTDLYEQMGSHSVGGFDLLQSAGWLALETQEPDGSWSYYYSETELEDTPTAMLILCATLDGPAPSIELRSTPVPGKD
jgi:hypothetical protein